MGGSQQEWPLGNPQATRLNRLPAPFVMQSSGCEGKTKTEEEPGSSSVLARQSYEYMIEEAKVSEGWEAADYFT